MLFKKIITFLKQYSFILLALLPFYFSDLQLRFLLTQKMTGDFPLDAVSFGFTLLLALFFVLVCCMFLSKKAGKIVYATVSSVFIVLSFSQYLYFRIFKKFFWLKAIMLSQEATSYLGVALQNVDSSLLLCTGLSICSMVVSLVFWNKIKCNYKISLGLVALPLIGFFALHNFMLIDEDDSKNKNWDAWNTPQVVYSRFNDTNKCIETCGFSWTTVRDLYHMVKPDHYDEDAYQEVKTFFDQKGPLGNNDHSGIFEGKNLIVVMMESMDSWIISEKYTPTISYMMKNGISFTNYHSPFFGEGHTFNAEFAFNTGFVTPKSSINATAFTSNAFPEALPQLFKNKGYRTNSYHFNNSEFYNRGAIHKDFGYERYYSFTDFGLSENDAKYDSNILKSDNIYAHMTSDAPFFDFIITYSNHLPYDTGNDMVRTLLAKKPHLIDPNMSEEQNNCMILASDTDDFFAELLKRLDADGLLENTVIAAFTDHYTYGYTDAEQLLKRKGEENLYRVPAFIYCKGMEKETVSKPMMGVDWIPTISNLFALTDHPYCLGNDIFAPENSGFVFFGDMHWIDGRKSYGINESDYINKQNQKVETLTKINDIVVKGDYFAKDVYENKKHSLKN
ncbi:MAG: LTA synthase family protein [Clostridia bacterium]|nr:LTA synthase family protein [Clostridia bacterium]